MNPARPASFAFREDRHTEPATEEHADVRAVICLFPGCRPCVGLFAGSRQRVDDGRGGPSRMARRVAMRLGRNVRGIVATRIYGVLSEFVLLVSTHALEFMRWAGAAYLVYLGYKQWRGTGLTGAQPAENARRGLFWRGFATSGLNPKTLLFFPSFFPQFISTESPWSASEQYLALAATFTLIFVLGVSSMALFSHRLGAVLQRPLCMKAFNRVSSALLVGMGVLLAGVR